MIFIKDGLRYIYLHEQQQQQLVIPFWLDFVSQICAAKIIGLNWRQQKSKSSIPVAVQSIAADRILQSTIKLQQLQTMNSMVSMNRSNFSSQLIKIQQERRINRLLNKKYEYKPIKNYDPVYNQLYIICEQPDSTNQLKATKTQRRSYTKHASYDTEQKNNNLTEIKKHKKTYSQSVQLPRISKKFQQSLKIQNKERKQQESYSKTKKITKQQKINIRPAKINLMKSEVFQNNRQSQLNTLKKRHQTLGNQQQKNQKKISQFTLTARIKHNKIAKNSRQANKINKQWKEIDILKLQTFFVKMKKQKASSLKQQINISRLVHTNRNFAIPSKQKIPDFIKAYKPLNPIIDVNNLVRDQKFGIQLDENTAVYFGNIQQGKKNKYGIYICQYFKYEGLWKNDDKIQGFEITPNGYYKGKFKNNKRDGEGEYIWKNGQFYSGQWKEGLKNGSGVWKSGKGDSYLGQLKEGKVEGEGVHITAAGQRYQGTFKQFLKDGKGKELFPNGDSFQGFYKLGHPHGKGKYTWKNGVIYEGPFQNGYRKGVGLITAKNYLIYEGQFLDDLPNGNGQLCYDKGDHYIGQFKNGEKNGKGTLKLKQQHKVLTGNWNRNRFEFAQQN